MTDQVIFNDAASPWLASRSQRMVGIPNAVAASLRSYILTVKQNTADVVHAYSGPFIATPWTQHDASIGNEFQPNHVECWWDRWTPGDFTGNEIHIVWSHTGSGAGVYYQKYDVSTDTVTHNKIVVVTNAGELPNSTTINTDMGIIRLDNGDIYIFIKQGGSTQYFGLFKSTNDGASFSKEFSHVVVSDASFELMSGVRLNEIVHIVMTNAAGAPDSTTPWFFINDNDPTQQRIFLATYNGTNALIEKLVIDTDIDDSRANVYHQMSASLRHGDRKVFLSVFKTDWDDAANLLRCHKITNISTTVEMAEIVTNADIVAAGDEVGMCQICIDQITGTLYVGYFRSSNMLTGGTKVYWKKSLNGGQSWRSENLSTDGSATDLRTLAMPRSVGDINELDQIFLAVFDDDNNDWLVSDNDFIVINAYTVRTLTDGGADQTEVNCVDSNPFNGGGGSVLEFYHGSHPRWFPKSDGAEASAPPFSGEQGFVSYGGKRGTINVGDRVIGAKSRATGIFAGKLSYANRALITSFKPGLNGDPFLPNETIHVVGDTGRDMIVSSIMGTSAGLVIEELVAST